jgi:UDP-N-acetylenolpyruvoylglucosamine reductase
LRQRLAPACWLPVSWCDWPGTQNVNVDPASRITRPGTAPAEPLPAGLLRDYPMHRLSTLRIGGPADYFARLESVESLQPLLRWAKKGGLPVGVIGSGSNLLIADDGFRGLVLKLSGSLATIERQGDSVICGGGARLPAVAAKTARWGLAGLEFGINIPGTVGGSIKMNANAFGGELADRLEWAEICDADGIRRRPPNELGFGYRSSAISSGQVVVAASFELSPRSSDAVSEGIEAVRRRRRETQPLGIRTLGSTFRNPDESIGQGERAAARLLAEAGCQELRVGHARFSPEHANFIQLEGAATAREVVELLALARQRVQERFDVKLEPEVQVLGEIDWPSGWDR